MITEYFLPHLVYNATTINDIPLNEQVELSKNLVACQLVCRRWRVILQEEMPFHLYRDAFYVTEGDQVSWDRLRVKGK